MRGNSIYELYTYKKVLLPISIIFPTLILCLTTPSELSNKITAIWLLFVSIVFVLKVKNNAPILITSLIILYSNYSIAIGEFLVTVPASCPLTQVKNPFYYGIAIRSVLIFISLITVFYKSRPLKKIDLPVIRNDLAFYGLVLILVYFFITGIRKDIERISYTVFIRPEYEYSRMFFLYAYWLAGKSKLNKSVLFILALAYMVQDAYFGGRITSLQIVLFLLMTYFSNYIKLSRLLPIGIVGLLVFSLVGAYRMSYQLNLSFGGILKALISSFFVLDTATYSFYASATHIAAARLLSPEARALTLVKFLSSIFLGSRFVKGGEVTQLANEYFRNIGGGIIATHFYFLGSWLGVIIASLLITFILNKISSKESFYCQLLLLSVAISSPRWYLYGPIVFFRGAILLPLILYFLIWMVRHMLVPHKFSKKKEFSITAFEKRFLKTFRSIIQR